MRLKLFPCLALLFACCLAVNLQAFEIGGGGSEQHPPREIKAGQPGHFEYIVSTWGEGGPIKGRFTNLVLHYRLTGAPDFQTVAAQPAPLPENYRRVMSKLNQWEAYDFIIPPSPAGQTGTIEYYITGIFDGNEQQEAGVTTIMLVP